MVQFISLSRNDKILEMENRSVIARSLGMNGMRVEKG